MLGEGLCAMVSAWLLQSVIAAVSYVPDNDEGQEEPAGETEEDAP